MPVNMESNTKDIKTKAVISRTAEVIAVINILADPKHHEFIKPWIEKVYFKLSENSTKMLKLISELPYQGIEFFEIVLDTRIFDDVEMLCKKIMNYEADQFTYILTGEQVKIEVIKKIRENNEEFQKFIDELPWLYRGNKDIYEWIFNNTEDFKLNLVNLISEINNPAFEKKFNYLSKKYENALHAIEVKLNKNTHLQLAGYIMNRTVAEDSKINEYIFIPSYFINPHYVMAFNKYARMFLYDIRRETSADIKDSREKLSSELKILSDKTRLEILRLLILQPCSGIILSNRLNLTTATISHHIDLLRSVDLISEIRDKNTKYYSANVEKIDALLENLKNYLYNN
jgi:DNA-binding transcriptional ArsR family regulator